MRVKMKKIFILAIGLYVCMGFSAQTSNDVIKKMQQIRQESGDSVARDYLTKNQSVFISENANPTYLAMWGLLTSNMWNSNPSESLRVEYKNYLDSVIDEEIKSDSYMPDQASLPTLWQLTRDYYLILNREGDRENVLNLLKCIHRWFKPFPDMRNTVGYAQSLLDLSLLLDRDFHRYEEGQPYAEEYVEVSKNVYGETSAQYAVAIYNMHIFPSKPISEKAEIIKKAISIYEKAEYQDHAILDEMKATYQAQVVSLTGVTNTDKIDVSSGNILSEAECLALVAAGRGTEALESLLYYKEAFSKEQHLDTLKYSAIISYIVATYIHMHDLGAAQKEIDSLHALIGIDNLPLEYAQIFYSSASLISFRLKDYATALKYAHTACKMSEKSSATAIEYCKILANISLMYLESANYTNKHFYLDAKWYIDEAISVFEEKVGSLSNHGAIGLILLNYKAMIYDAIGDKKGAIDTYEKIVSDFSGNIDVRGAWILATNNLAALYMKTDHLEKAIKMLESLSSENKEYNQLFKQNLALAHNISDDPKLKSTLKDYNNICYNNCLDVFNFFTEAEREDFWAGNARELLVVNNLVADKHPEIADVAYNNLLFVKNLKLMSSDILKRIVESSSNLELKKKYNNALSLRDAISYRSKEQDSIRIWNNQLKEEERSILSLVPDYKERLLSAFHSWDEIRDALKDDEIAVDFTYVPKMKEWDNADGFYGAFVLTKNSVVPLLVSLCEVDSINQYFTGSISDAMQISLFYKESHPIYKKLWGNLEDFFKGKKTIYFSPTGQLNLLNHDALIMPNGKRFGEKYDLIRLSSIDKILLQQSKKSNANQYESAVVYGGIDYDLTIKKMTEVAKLYKHHSNNNMMAMRSDNERGHWDYLPGTKEESKCVFDILKSDNIPTQLLQDAIANEESFKALSGHSPSIIHLSTHGFFLNNPEKVMTNPFMSKIGSYSEKEDKLIRTGVLMAGANNEWCGINHVTGIEDGILTADEISRLDLSGTKIVVLAACETAQGHIDEIDGILGLQRGFKKAGANTILMSLNKVDDEATTILMVEFYRNLVSGKTKRQSLQEAQHYLRKVDNGKYDDPKYWASFIMLDGLN